MPWDWVEKLRYNYEVLFEKCIDEYCMKLSFHDVLESIWKEHDAIWYDVNCMCDNIDTAHIVLIHLHNKIVHDEWALRVDASWVE